MPFYERDGARIRYAVQGEGDPLLLIAPGGMRSHLEAWERLPFDLVGALAAEHRVVTMDQRNAGESTAPIRGTDGWDTYTADQLGLMEHLGCARFGVVGMCIGGAYIANLFRHAPERIARAAMLQPIGLEDNRDTFYALFDGWADELREAHPEASEADWAAFRAHMFGGDFLFAASREDVAAIEAPLLVLRGDDVYHPASISREVAELAPRGELLERSKEPEHHEAAQAALLRFLAPER